MSVPHKHILVLALGPDFVGVGDDALGLITARQLRAEFRNLLAS